MKTILLFAVTALLGFSSCTTCTECTDCSSERTICRDAYATEAEYQEALDAAEFAGCECFASL